VATSTPPHPASARAATATIVVKGGAGLRGAGLGRRALTGGGRFGLRLQLRHRQFGADALELGLFPLGLRLTGQPLLGEGGAGVEFEPHLLRRLARLGEHAQGLVQPHGVALGGVVLMATVPRRQQIDQPEHDGDEDDHAAAENLSTHGLHGRAAARLSPACAPRV
jgi:hypothetical protein